MRTFIFLEPKSFLEDNVINSELIPYIINHQGLSRQLSVSRYHIFDKQV